MTEPCTDTPEIDLLTWPVLRSTDIAPAVPTDRSPTPALPTQLKHSTDPRFTDDSLYRFLSTDSCSTTPHTPTLTLPIPVLTNPPLYRPPSLIDPLASASLALLGYVASSLATARSGGHTRKRPPVRGLYKHCRLSDGYGRFLMFFQ